MDETSTAEQVLRVARRARQASHECASLSSRTKQSILEDTATLIGQHRARIEKENQKDLKGGEEKGLSAALIDRLKLTENGIKGLIASLHEIAQLADPVGAVEDLRPRPNGLMVGRMVVPLGVIAVIYESRPNVTVDAAALCLKAGNAVILRGGSEAYHSNRLLAELLQDALRGRGVSPYVIQPLLQTEHEAVNHLLTLDEYVDVVIPRGGEALIRAVAAHARMPVIKHYKGICHTYVDRDANLEMAEEISFNAKVQRPGVCNAMETLLVHRDVARAFLPRMAERFRTAGVEMRADPDALQIVTDARAATEEDWSTEYLDLIVSIRIVDSMDQAIDHIQRYGSRHSDAIITDSYSRSCAFVRRVDSSSVFVNASTRFADGGEYGLGAEIGISTDKLHARGPMGARELTSRKFVVLGQGHIRT